MSPYRKEYSKNMKKKKKKTVELTCFDLKWSTGQGRREREREKSTEMCLCEANFILYMES
jgi:hypothetical protein